jgi:hypothetical protein
LRNLVPGAKGRAWIYDNGVGRYALQCADALHWFAGMSRQKAYLLLTTFMTAIDVETIPFAEMSTRMRRAFEEQKGTAVRFTLPQKGNAISKKIKEHVQPVDTLAKMRAGTRRRPIWPIAKA